MADYDFGKKYIETSSQVLGLCTPASRPAQTEQLKQKIYSTTTGASHPLAPLSMSNFSLEQVNAMVTNLEEGEIMKGLHSNDPLLPSRRHLIKEVSILVDYSDNLIVSLSSLRVLAQISKLHQFEPDANLANLAPNRLLAILQEEPGILEKVKNNFIRRLEREETENVQFLADGKDFSNLISTWFLLNAQGDEIDRIISPEFCEAFGLTNYIRLFIVNFFVENVTKNSFNLVHYVLGFSQEFKDINFFNGCLSLLIDMLMYGLGHPSVEAPVVFIEHPALGVKLLNLLKSLLLAPEKFSDPAREYLRNDREVFYELASNINTRLLQVSFSADKGYALSTDYETTLPSTALNFHVFELQQKAVLFQIISIDLHEASGNGRNRLYIERMIRTLLKSTAGSSLNEFGSTLASGESRIIDFLAAIDNITEDSNLKRIHSQNIDEFEGALVVEFETACGDYIESLMMLIGEVLSLLTNFEELVQERQSLVDSLQAWIFKFMQKSILSARVIESLVQLLVLIDFSSFDCSQDALNAQISVLLRPEINATIRCFLYTALMRQNYQIISQNLSEDRFLRLVELVTRDALISTSGAVNDSLITVAFSTLEFLYRARPSLLQDALLSNSKVSNSFYYSIPTAVTSTAPFIPSLLDSLKIDDAIACSLIVSQPLDSNENFSIFLKWRAKWSFLLNLIARRQQESENNDKDISSNFANRFIDGGFLESVVFKLRCLSLPIAYHLVDSGQLVLASILPVLKFICALGIATDRQVAVSSRLLDLFRSSDVFDAFAVIISNFPSDFSTSVHAQVTRYILLLVNGVIRGSKFEDLSAKLISFRLAVLKQMVRKSWLVYRFRNNSPGSFLFLNEEEISNPLETEIQILQEFMDFLTLDSNQFIDAQVTSLTFVPPEFNDELITSLSLGTLIFLLKTCISKIQQGRERADFLKYLAKNLENLSQSDLDIIFNSKKKFRISLNDTDSITKRINQLYVEIIELQNHLVILFEKTAFLLLKHLRHKLSSISTPSGGFSSTFYIDNSSPLVQSSRSLKSDASIIVLPIIEIYCKNIQLADSSANSSLYMTILARDFFDLLSAQAIQSNSIFEI